MAPTQLGPYRILSSLGRGGMGAVYEAIDDTTGTIVAVKTLAAHVGDDPGLRRRFFGEIETLKSLRHPCIVELHAFGEDDGQPFFAMELVRGRSLEQILRGGRIFSWRETVAVAIDVARALKSAHDHGVVHRDLKPANLLFPDDPTPDAAIKLADFGIARLFGASSHTMAGTIVGTADYMAPEQAAGVHVDHRVDLYALGLVMFAMMTGRSPFHGGQPTEVLRRQRTEPAPRISSRVADVPPALDDLIDRLLAKDPSKRPASALALGRQLAAIAAGGAAAAVPVTLVEADANRTLGAAGAVTDCNESDRATAASPGQGRDFPARQRVDLEAVTQDFARGITAAEAAIISDSQGRSPASADTPTMPLPTAPDAPATPLAKQVTTPNAEGGEPQPLRTSHFTTVEDLHREHQALEASRARRDLVLRAAAAAVLLGGVAFAALALLRPPSADDLHARITSVADAPDADLRDARADIARFLSMHPNDPRAAAVRDLDRRLDLDTLEKRARRRRGSDRDMPPLEREYRAAMAREAESPIACLAALEAILALHAHDASAVAPVDHTTPPEEQPALWIELVRRQVARLAPLAEQEQEQDIARADATLATAAALADQAAAATDDADRDRLLDQRRQLLTSLIEIYGSRPHAANAVAQATSLLAAPAPAPTP